jgi:hypothetical protein
MLRSIENWEQNDVIGGSLAIDVHTASHLNEVRQALCTVGERGNKLNPGNLECTTKITH